MSDRGALAAALDEREQETSDREQGADEGQTLTPAHPEREQETGDREQGADEGQTLTPVFSQGEREKAAERIRQSEMLPVGLRTRLAELVLASDGAAAEQAIRAVEASLPGALRISAGEVARPAHPAGDVFFRGDADAMSEEQAEVLARGQLARSGMLRGQRVRVAE